MPANDIEPFPDPFPDGGGRHATGFFDIQNGWEVSAGEFHLPDEMCCLLPGVLIRQEIMVGSAPDTLFSGLTPVSVETWILQPDTLCRFNEGEAHADAAFAHFPDGIPRDMPLVVGYVYAEDAEIRRDRDAEAGISGESGPSVEDVVGQDISEDTEQGGECQSAQDPEGV